MVNQPQVAQELLPRRLKVIEAAALTFSGVGCVAGLYSLFGFSFSTAGPAFIWGWVIVSVIAAFTCLTWAELASHMPLAGSLFHWSRAVSGPSASWWVGWTYLLALIVIIPGWFFIIPVALGPLIGVEFTSLQSSGIVFVAILLAAMNNILGVKVLGKLASVGTALELVVGIGLTLWLFFASDHQPVSIFFDTGPAANLSAWWPALLGGGMFVAIWVLYAFEFAGAVGEETEDAHRAAPRGLLLALAGTLIIGTLTLVTFVLAVPNVSAISNSATPVPDLLGAWLPSWAVKTYLLMLLWIAVLGTNAFFAAVVRQLFGMARAGQLPCSTLLSRTRNGNPYVAIITVAVISMIPLIFSQQMAVLATGGTACMYATYCVVLGLVLRGRLRGWPRRQAPFSLGRWGVPVNLAAFAGALFVFVLLVWPNDNTNPVFHGIRVAYWLLGGIAVFGAVVYLLGRDRLVLAGSADQALIDLEESEAWDDSGSASMRPMPNLDGMA